MPTVSEGLAATVGADGRIYAMGGFSGTGFLNSVEAYDPATNLWATVASLPTATDSLAAASADGIVYAIGGASGNGTVGTVETLSIQPLHVLSGSLTAGTINLALTEGTPFNGPITTFQASNTLETASNFAATINWGDGTPNSAGTITGGFGQFTVSGSHTYAQPGNYAPTVNIIDSTGLEITAGGSLSWQEAPSMTTASAFLASAVGLDGRIYALGGANNNLQPINTVQAYNTATSSWTTLAPMPTARLSFAAATGANGLIYAIGGDGSGSVVSAVEAYDPATNTWMTMAPLPTAVANVTAATGPDGRIYIFGGRRQQQRGIDDGAGLQPLRQRMVHGGAAAGGPLGRRGRYRARRSHLCHWRGGQF